MNLQAITALLALFSALASGAILFILTDLRARVVRLEDTMIVGGHNEPHRVR